MVKHFKQILIDISNQSPDVNRIIENINEFISQNDLKKVLICITGPTVTGKTSLSLSLSKQLPFEIISADSRQIYEKLNIGTNKITNYKTIQNMGEKCVVYEGIFHYMIDILQPEEKFSVSNFTDDAKRIISKIHNIKKIPLVVGGTGYYIKNLISNDVFPEYKITQEIKDKVQNLSYEESIVFLKKNDPEILKLIDIKNPRRLQSPIQFFLSKGVKLSDSYGAIKNDNPYAVLLIRLTGENDILYANADKKLEERLEDGLIEEVQNLINQGVSPDWLKQIGLEYKFVTEYIQGLCTKEEMIQKLKFAIHHYIKRQKTYLNKYL